MRRLAFVWFMLIAVMTSLAQTAPQQQAGPLTGSGQASPTSGDNSIAASVNQGDNAKKARAILERAIEALGGPAYLGIKDTKQEGRTYRYYQGKPNSLGTVYWRFSKFPDKDRVEYTKQRDVVFIINGDKGYEVSYKGTAAQEPDALKESVRSRNHSLDWALRVWFPDPKTALFYDGPAVAEQKPCDSVTLFNAQNDSVTIFIDQNTHLPVKTAFQWRDPSDKLKNDESEVYDGYRAEQGIMTAHMILRSKNGEITNQRFITSVQYNTGIPDSMFDAKVTYDPYKKSGPRQ